VYQLAGACDEFDWERVQVSVLALSVSSSQRNES